VSKLTLAGGLTALKGADYARLLEQSAFDIGIYVPDGSDHQTPHRRDEIYVIAQGEGQFICGKLTYNFRAGDVFFVPASTEHRFVNFSAGFSTWVIFLGQR
jgi:mannose-6-phosphate isomerase-like protein (cupin superfamily)